MNNHATHRGHHRRYQSSLSLVGLVVDVVAASAGPAATATATTTTTATATGQNQELEFGLDLEREQHDHKDHDRIGEDNINNSNDCNDTARRDDGDDCGVVGGNVEEEEISSIIIPASMEIPSLIHISKALSDDDDDDIHNDDAIEKEVETKNETKNKNGIHITTVEEKEDEKEKKGTRALSLAVSVLSSNKGEEEKEEEEEEKAMKMEMDGDNHYQTLLQIQNLVLDEVHDQLYDGGSTIFFPTTRTLQQHVAVPEFNSSEISCGKELGRGEFGIVYTVTSLDLLEASGSSEAEGQAVELWQKKKRDDDQEQQQQQRRSVRLPNHDDYNNNSNNENNINNNYKDDDDDNNTVLSDTSSAIMNTINTFDSDGNFRIVDDDNESDNKPKRRNTDKDKDNRRCHDHNSKTKLRDKSDTKNNTVEDGDDNDDANSSCSSCDIDEVSSSFIGTRNGCVENSNNDSNDADECSSYTSISTCDYCNNSNSSSSLCGSRCHHHADNIQSNNNITMFDTVDKSEKKTKKLPLVSLPLRTNDDSSTSQPLPNNNNKYTNRSNPRSLLQQRCLRNGRPRYAVKRLRDDFGTTNYNNDNDNNNNSSSSSKNDCSGNDAAMTIKFAAMIDLVVEYNFLQSLKKHPNIIKLRGIVGQPGTETFMIIMDCLSCTLRQRMEEWRTCRTLGRSHCHDTICTASATHDNRIAIGGDTNETNTTTTKNFVVTRLINNMIEQFDDYYLLGGSRGNHHQQPQDSSLIPMEDINVFTSKLIAVFDIARGMKFLHDKKILYRDCKPDNIGFDVRNRIKIFDFGLAKELKTKDLVNEPNGYQITGLTGSRRYMSPENCLCKPYGLPSDVYSYSIVLWEVLSDAIAYKTMDYNQHFRDVVMNDVRPAITNEKLNRYPLSLMDLTESMWDHQPNKRPTFKYICQIIKHELHLLGHDRTSQLLQSSSRRRRRRRRRVHTEQLEEQEQEGKIDYEHHLSNRTNYLLGESARSIGEAI